MSQSIRVRYLGPTDTRGSRLKATCGGGSLTVPYDHALSHDALYATAALALVMPATKQDASAPVYPDWLNDAPVAQSEAA